MKFKKVTKNELADRARFHKKHSKGMGWYDGAKPHTTFQGDPVKEMEIFNHMQPSGPVPGSDTPNGGEVASAPAGGDAGGGMGEALELEALNKDNLIPDDWKEFYEVADDNDPRTEEAREYWYNPGDKIEGYDMTVIGYAAPKDGWEEEMDARGLGVLLIVEDTKKKRNGKWVNKGDDGEHGEFRTKKEADAQRKAMFANGFHESLGAERDKIFAQIKEINPYAKEENYSQMEVNQMLAVLSNMRNKAKYDSALDELNDDSAEEATELFTGVRRDPEDGQLYHYEDGVKGELATEEEADYDEIDEALNMIDHENDNEFDLRTSFRMVKWKQDELNELNKLIESKNIKNINKAIKYKLNESFEDLTEATDEDVKAELASTMEDWNYDDDEIGAAFAYCEENNVDYRKLEDWEFEYIVRYVNNYDYNPLVHDSWADFELDLNKIINDARKEIVDEDYNLKQGWTVSDIKLHQDIDWKARNYQDYPVETDSFIGNAILYGDGAPKIKECEFVKYIRPNNIFPPYYAPKDNPFPQGLGPMYDGNRHGRYDVHDRYETQSAYDMYSR